ncbi:tetratricopeptide repeat protein [Pseudonocardia sp. HH130630-07]|uniref:tetratricopeptide repeat protein n=1 Tax=Pseudonocardia sp. HH130630-07 TaxID=1690815 RepID=UPI000814EE54|nr:tetratricopeptide repeat protein [Pseudonocardia sp. HH130630-07]ANY07875.1 hypothetical protein AFB00_17970 [Pseudonocardia sp. HH130630-07]
MQAFVRRAECGHIVWAGPLVDTAALLAVADELRGGSCPTCGETVRRVEFTVVRAEGGGTFDTPPAPRNRENRLRRASRADAARTRRSLARLGADTTGLAADLKDAALGLAPPRWRADLRKIPVGILPTYEPNAECITFADSAVPAIVVHQGLAGYLFGMNRSVFPLLRTGSIGGGAGTPFVTDERTRGALRVQAVDTALQFLGVGPLRPAGLVGIPTVVRFLTMPLTRIMSAFVLCHEYGHAVLRHADDLHPAGPGSGFSLLERSRAMEFEADTWGQDAVIGAFSGSANLEPGLAMFDDLFTGDSAPLKKDVSLAAPCVALLYFEFLDVVEERLGRHGVTVAGRDAPTRRRARAAGDRSTHPSNHDRFRALYAHLTEHGNFSAHTWVEPFESFLGDIRDDLDVLIDRTGAVPGTRFAPRFRWLRRRRPERASGSWREPMADGGDPGLRRALEAGLSNASGEPLQLDAEVLRRHYERQTRRAQQHYDAGEYADAERLFSAVLDGGETVDSVALYPLLGMSREQLGDVEGAIAAYRRCMEVVPGSEHAAASGFCLGKMLWLDRADPDGAEPALRAALASENVDFRAQALLWLGTIAHGRRDVDEALRRYREVYALRGQALGIVPDVVPKAALNIGGVLENRGRRADAVRMFEYARDHPALDAPNRRIAEQRLRGLRGR